MGISGSIVWRLFETGIDVGRMLGLQRLYLQPELLDVQVQASDFPVLLGNGVVQRLDCVIQFTVEHFHSIEPRL